MQNSLKPSPFSPAPPKQDLSDYAHMQYKIENMKFNTPYRLNKTKRQKHTSISMPLRWRFSTMNREGLTEAEEQSRIDQFEMRKEESSSASSLF